MKAIFFIISVIIFAYNFSYFLYLFKRRNILQAMVVITLIVLSFVSGMTDTFFAS